MISLCCSISFVRSFNTSVLVSFFINRSIDFTFIFIATRICALSRSVNVATFSFAIYLLLLMLIDVLIIVYVLLFVNVIYYLYGLLFGILFAIFPL